MFVCFFGFCCVEVFVVDCGIGEYCYGVWLYFENVVCDEYEFVVVVFDFDVYCIWMNLGNEWCVIW